MSRKWSRIALAVITLLVIIVGVAWARPGGGGSYSGGGGHGGGGDGDGIGELIFFVIRLCIYYPAIGFPLLAIIIIYIVWQSYKQKQNQDWDSGPPVVLQHAISLDPIRDGDPEFSQVLFEDFAKRLFATAQRARVSEAALAAVGPYVSPHARQALLSRAPGVEVQAAIVGAMRPVKVGFPEGRVTISIEFESNIITAQNTTYTVETWVFGRDASRQSKPPGASKGFPCPNCGAPWQSNATGTQQCASCGQVVDNGRFDWCVDGVFVGSSDERGPTLTNYAPEKGTDLETYRDDDVDQNWKALRADDKALTEKALAARLTLIYDLLNTAWSKNELAPVRGLVSDGLYDYLTYWTETYKRAGLRNDLKDMKVERTEVAKIVRDKWYDAVTIRVWGRGYDTVVKADSGKRVTGSSTIRRKYSEYWTLIRSRGRQGAPNANPTCSNCGAPLAITMAGACEHCGAHLTAGNFDWVLSKIEQDDSYRG